MTSDEEDDYEFEAACDSDASGSVEMLSEDDDASDGGYAGAETMEMVAKVRPGCQLRLVAHLACNSVLIYSACY